MKEFKIDSVLDGMRLSRFVLRVTQNLPNSLLYKSFRKNRIKVNKRKAAPEYLLRTGDVVALYLNDEFFAETQAQAESSLFPHFSLIYEDELLAVIQKPAGVLSHRDEHGNVGLVEAYAQNHFQNESAQNFQPALCTRLDRNTEGLLLLAKTHPSLRALNALLREDAVQKDYLCLTSQKPPEGVFHAYLQRDLQSKTVRVTKDEQKGAKPISTEIECLGTKGSFWLCRVGLLTGRTHQIRAHLSFLGAPLLGDKKYNGAPLPTEFAGQGQALCAYRLRFLETLSKDSLLSYLAGRSFEAENTQLLLFWQALGGKTPNLTVKNTNLPDCQKNCRAAR